MRAARASCATTMPLCARTGATGGIAGAIDTGATCAAAKVTLTKSARIADNMRVIDWLRISPFVPAQAGTQFFLA